MAKTTPTWQQQKYPGPQRRTVKSILCPSFLLVLTIFVGVIFITQLVYAFGFTLSFYTLDVTQLPLGADKTATILIAFVSLLYARRNFAMGVRPILAFDYQVRDNSEMGLQLQGRVFRAKIRNAGSGIAIVSDVRYFLVADDQKSLETSNPTEVIKFLEGLAFRRLSTYDILVLRPGACLAPKEEKAFFETSPQDIKKILRFDVRVSFLGILGDEYIKWIFCAPREFELSLPPEE
jgi:hypothetical protein